MTRLCFLFLLSLLFLSACDKRELKDWTHVDGSGIPVYMGHFGDYVHTDEAGANLGTVQSGDGDGKDWQVFAYSSNDGSKGWLTGIAAPYAGNALNRPVKNNGESKEHTDSYRFAHGFIYPGEPATIVPDTLLCNQSFVFTTPSLEEAPDTPVIEYDAWLETLPCRSWDAPWYIQLRTANPAVVTRLSVTTQGGQWYGRLNHNHHWQNATPYPVNGAGEMVFYNIPVQGLYEGETSILFRDTYPHTPLYMGYEFSSFLTDEMCVRLSWLVCYTNDIQNIKLWRSESNDLATAVVVADLPAPAFEETDVDTMVWVDTSVNQNRIYYYWFEAITTAPVEDDYLGPVHVNVPSYPGPNLQNYPYGIATYPAYPNPTQGVVNIDYEINDSTEVHTLIINQHHEVVFRSSGNMRWGRHTQQVDMSNLQAGLYRVYYWLKKEGRYYYSYGDVLKEAPTP